MIEFFVGTVPVRAKSLAITLSSFDHPDQVKVITDRQLTGGSWSNIATALGECSPASDWMVMLDDDTLPCRHFEEEAKRALGAAPDDCAVASLFWGWRSSPVNRARKAGASWVRTEYFVYGAAWAIRSRFARECLDWNRSHVVHGLQVGDARISYWAAATGRRCYGLAPSIVQHHHEQSSIVQGGRSNASFQAIWFVEDASTIEWNSRSVDYGKSGADLLRSHARYIVS